MLEAVFFDLGNTLTEWTWDDELLEAGHRAGLAAIGHDGAGAAAAVTERWRSHYMPLLENQWDAPEEVEYSELARTLLKEVGVDVDDRELLLYLEAEHTAWEPASRLGHTTHAMLDSLRSRGLRLAIVSNTFDPPNLLHRDLDRLGLARRVDVSVFSSEVGFRKPHPAIFGRAVDALRADPRTSLFVGDSLYHDIRGAGELGMRTAQALWFRADDHPAGAEPDFQAFTQMDVLNIVERLRAS